MTREEKRAVLLDDFAGRPTYVALIDDYLDEAEEYDEPTSPEGLCNDFELYVGIMTQPEGGAN